ncbi:MULTISPECIES: hypothetical protein [Caballeronia]|uniref:Uncharacterized protein n=1 Tax=Caballeronia jiangsuensis TaxID=1458357 RepID=A0ABW9CVI8_9BURK|nr:hypothetical protein [Caballeronia sp. GaOx3]
MHQLVYRKWNKQIDLEPGKFNEKLSCFCRIAAAIARTHRASGE